MFQLQTSRETADTRTDPDRRAALMMSSAARLCEEYSACFCSSSVQPAAFRRGLDASAAYMAEAEQLRALIGRVQSSACGRGLRRFRVPLLGYGLGGSFYDHLRRLLPIWQAFIERPAHEVPPGIAVPASRFWVEQRLRWSRHSERPLGGKPVLQFLVDIEAASHCQALVGTMDSHASRLILLRMASRLGAVPPFYSLVAPSCPMTTLPKQTERFCLNHTLAKSAGVNDGESSVCPGLVTPEYRHLYR